MNILIYGDIIGRGGRKALAQHLSDLRTTRQIDCVIANGENIAHGRGITPETAQDLFDAGVNVITGGNHMWDARPALELLQKEPRIIRPANMPPGAPGKGSAIIEVGVTTIAVLNLLGRAFMREQYDDPFRTADRWLEELPRVQPLITLVDVHAEATSEKRALGLFLDGRVTAVWGTHTHVVTGDEQLLPQGTAYLTDLGMTGAYHSILGFESAPLIERARTQLPVSFDVLEEGPWEVNALLLIIDERTGRARSIERIRQILSSAS